MSGVNECPFCESDDIEEDGPCDYRSESQGHIETYIYPYRCETCGCTFTLTETHEVDFEVEIVDDGVLPDYMKELEDDDS